MRDPPAYHVEEGHDHEGPDAGESTSLLSETRTREDCSPLSPVCNICLAVCQGCCALLFIHPCVLPLMCIALLAFCIPVTAEVLAWHRISNCHTQEGLRYGWNSVLPVTTMSQKPIKFSQIFYSEVDVFDDRKSNDTKVGFWTDADVLLGMFQRYGYTDLSQGSERLLVQAQQPFFKFYLGKRRLWSGCHQYNLWLCSELEQGYSIEQDVWATPWFQLFNPQRVFKILDMQSRKVLANVTLGLENLWSFRQAAWTGAIMAPDGTLIATLQQETAASAGWFTNPKWYTQNLRPDLLPNEVVSFLSAVYDIDRSKKSSSSSSSSSSRRRR